MRKVPFVDLGAQYRSIRHEVEAAMSGVLERCDFILGGSVAEFEAEMAAYCEASFGVGVDSGTSALELALMALDVGPGDEVITAANTFIASTLAISYVGATPVLVDIDPDTYQIDVNQIEAAITPRTKAIMPVHLYGHPAEMGPILEIASRHRLKVLEDASQAHGARYQGRRVGALGDIGAFSLYPAKNLGAYGDAGVLVTNDPDLDNKLRLLRNYGSTKKYHHDIKGFNRRLDTLQAAVLRVKLAHLDGWNAARRSHAAEYTRILNESGAATGLPSTAAGCEPVYHLYVIRHSDRDGLQRHLTDHGIGTVIHYPIPIHLQPAYADLRLGPGSFPVTEAYSSQILSLPMFAELTADDISYVCEKIAEFDGGQLTPAP